MTTDKSRDAAAFLCARFVSRTDIKNIYLSHVIQWACDVSMEIPVQNHLPVRTVCLIDS